MARSPRPRVPWLAVIVGVVLGIPAGLALGSYSTGTPTEPSFAWELSLGVLLGGLTGWVIPEVVNQFRSQWKTSMPLREMLGPLHDNAIPTTVFLASLYPTGLKTFEKSVPLEIEKKFTIEPHHGMPWVLTEGDGIALGYLMGILGKAGRTENTTITRDDSGIDISQCNLVCIGSPKSNLVAQHINDSFKNLPVKFDQENSRQILRSADSSRIWRADDIYDYGVVMKTDSDYDDHKVALILAGISFAGTAGAAYYLWQRWREIVDSERSNSFGVVVRVRRDNYKHVERVWPTNE
jgi:hypothetical protein